MTDTLHVHPAEARRRFSTLITAAMGPEDLARGALLIALEEYPGVDVEGYLAQLGRFAAEVASGDAVREGPDLLADRLCDVLAPQFRGNMEDYYDPRNAYLNEVLERRVGLPVTLSILYIHVGRLAGLAIEGVGLPGHYVVKFASRRGEVFLDPFQGGVELSQDDLAALVSSVSGGKETLGERHLRASTDRETLARVLVNLHAFHSMRGESRKAATARDRLSLLEAAAIYDAGSKR